MPRSTMLAAAVLLSCLMLGAGCASHSAPPAEATAKPPVYRVNAGLINLVKCPNMDCDIVEDLHGGQEVALLSPQIGDWILVRVLATGHEGYVPVRFLRH